MANGMLFYVIGPSGAGKDTLMNYARQQLNGQYPVLFAHRYITRPVEAGGENHICLSTEEFRLRQELGLFALHWHSHGNYYGIGTEINGWLEKGVRVVVNGSREYLPFTREKYPNLVVLWVSVSPERLYERLVARGRESEPAIQSRLERASQFSVPDHPYCIQICNDTTLENSGGRFLEAITGYTYQSQNPDATQAR